MPIRLAAQGIELLEKGLALAQEAAAHGTAQAQIGRRETWRRGIARVEALVSQAEIVWPGHEWGMGHADVLRQAGGAGPA